MLLALLRNHAACQVPVLSVPLVHADTIRGTISDSSGVPIEGVTIIVTSAENLSWKSIRTNASGTYFVVVANSGPGYTLAAMLPGYIAQRRHIVTVANRVTTADFHLLPAIPVLDATRSVAKRAVPRRDVTSVRATPGTTPAPLNQGSGLSGDLTGDGEAAFAAVPGLILTPDRSGNLTVSAFGLNADQNRATLDGMDFAGGLTLRDGLVGDVLLSSYDPKRGRAIGALVDWRLPPGSDAAARTTHVTLDDPHLESSQISTPELGNKYQRVIASGSMSGPVVRGRSWYSMAYQVSRRSSEVTTLNSANKMALSELGISSDSAAKFLDAATALGMPLSVANMPAGAVHRNATLLTRWDLANVPQERLGTGGTDFSLVAGGSWTQIGGLDAAPNALASRLARSTTGSGQLIMDASTFVRGVVLDDAKVSLSANESELSPGLALPTATVLVSSASANGSVGSAVLAAGGGSVGENAKLERLEVSNEASWFSWNQRHRFEIFVDGEFARASLAHEANELGTFSYQSLADFVANRPFAFTRLIGARTDAGAGTALATVGISDTYTPASLALVDNPMQQDGLAVQYGIRGDAEHVDRLPSASQSVAALSGASGDRRPRLSSIAPMFGFTYNMGRTLQRAFLPVGIAIRSLPRNSVTGGIREYWSTVPPQAITPIKSATGNGDGARELECVGSAVPSADWTSYAQSVEGIPETCAGPSSSPFAEEAPSATLFARDYVPPHSWRGELKWTHVHSGRLQGWVGSTYALNLAQTQPFDINFSPNVQFSLPDEDGRPVFESPSSIVSETGALSSLGSRRVPTLGHVIELRSDLKSNQQTLTAGMAYRLGVPDFQPGADVVAPRVTGNLSIQLTLAASKAQTNGFASNTPGNPRVVEWIPGASPAKTVQMSLDIDVARFATVSTYIRASSGFAFTPVVGSDINGDGYANDRALVFGPSRTRDSAVASGMLALLSNAGSGVRRCLRAQLGLVAGPNSCRTPWSMGVGTVALQVDPYRVGLGNRGTLRLYFENVLPMIDAALHGSGRLRGWGQAQVPDPVLLTVLGFNASTRQYKYSINPRFGQPSAAAFLGRQPFRVTADVRLDLGPDAETQRIKRYVRRDPSDGPWTESALAAHLRQATGGEDFGWLINSKFADEIHLTESQRRQIESIGHEAAAERDSIFIELARFLISQSGSLGSEPVRRHWHQAFESDLRMRVALAHRIAADLTAEQLARVVAVAPADGFVNTSSWLERYARGPLP
ncbi:MAG TPA: carboxypeptidase regulatory-like domain-containing protein [Gemmatimonadaceae bacterium]|nr:carboxypeptidase regulatory-like domain-containing protein [Gemmatimonadaceae bacterium]